MATRREFLWKSLLGGAAATAWGLAGVRAVTRGLPSPAGQGATKKKILILGAGMAGMVAALELIAAGHEVTLLEADTRPGGRVRTLREPFSDGLFAEAGAGRIPEWHDLTFRYIKECGLRTEPFRPSEGNMVLHLRGQRYRLPTDDDLSLANLPFELSAEERVLTLGGLLAKYVDPVLAGLGNPGSPGWPSAEVARFDTMTWVEALRGRGASKGATDLLLALVGFPKVSALDFFRDDLGHRGAKSLWRIAGGNDALPRALSAKLAGQIVYGAQVTKIQHDPDKVWVKFRQAGLQRAFLATHVLCTLPFTVLRHLEIAPLFSPPKVEVIEKWYLDPVVRVFAQTRTRFWESAGLNGWAATDDPLDIWQPTFSQPGQRGILHTYIEDGLALEVSRKPVEERVKQSLAAIARAFPELPDYLESASEWCWDDQPFARGAYTVLDVGQVIPWRRIASAPEGRVHFAGEHTSAFPGWIQGAIESGLRAAGEIHRA